MTVKNNILLCIVLLSFATVLRAQTGGPGQPEFMQFKPASASDLVSPSTGSFSYNIPLFDVGGYPVNLSYQSGVGLEDVASIVGLGWNVNIGAVSHTMRGLPDDFKGDIVTRTIYMKENKTYGGNLGVGVELIGFPASVGLSAGYGIFYNNYNGWGVEQSFGLSFSIHNKAETRSAGLSLGMKANSQSGVDIYAQPTVSLQLSKSSDLATNGSLGGMFSVNSQTGLKASVNASMSVSACENYSKTDKKKEMSEQLAAASASYSFSKTPEIPRVSYPFSTKSFTGSFKAGGEIWYLHLHGELKGYSSSQKLRTNTIATPAYGFLYSEAAPEFGDNVLHDFNREKDQPYIKDASINIGIPSFTNDIYSVNAQGISGSFQLNRNDIGVIFDNKVVSSGSDVNIGVELGFGNAFHAGAAISTTSTFSSSGKWNSAITPNIKFKKEATNSLFQSAYFKNASDVSVDENGFYAKLGGDRAFEVQIENTPWYQKEVNTESLFTDNVNPPIVVNSTNFYKEIRDPRTINIQYKTATFASQFGLVKTIDAYRVNDFSCNNIVSRQSREDNTIRKGHHISEMISTNADGMRYVFGLPTYNTTQKEVSFTLESAQQPDNNGSVSYSQNTNWGENGKDGFYESTELPPYVTSHLLTGVLSPEYIDVDDNGPTLNDVGNYVKINYSYAGIYKWRTPYGQNKATFNKAFLSDPRDNKGSYVYGEKELWYTHSIESKTQIAEFYYDVTRKDGLGVAGETGGADLNQRLYKLDSIKVYSINERVLRGNQAVPIRIIYFKYDYSLCQGVNNSADNTGKLTLKKVSFASGKSRREVQSPYEFTYGTMPNGTVINPPYKAMNTNRWGNYEENQGALNLEVSTPLSIIDYPYASQNEATMNKNSYAWNLTKIKLPSGGTIRAEYEAHRYSYTQDQRCMEMVPIKATGPDLTGSSLISTSTAFNCIKIDFPLPLTALDQRSELLYRYFANDINQWYYYKTLVNLRSGIKEWISGYFKIKDIQVLTPTSAAIQLENVCRDDNNCNVTVSPILKNAWQFMRMNRPDISYGPAPAPGEGLEQFLKLSDLNDKVGDQINAFMRGFNEYAQIKGFASSLDTTRSFIRLYSPYKKKIIGGSRVHRVITDDNWKAQTQNTSASKSYTIDYDYTDIEKNPVTGLPDTVSSGVVEYEPFNGQDENPMRQPIFINQHIKMAPDNMLYTETPFNESLFPATNLTYSKVTITSNKTDLPVPTTGHQEMEFYTAKDYPVQSSITDLGSNHEKKTNFLASFVMSIFGLNEFHDYVTLSQGASITLNDMHGKQKATRNYNSNGSLISSEQSLYSLGQNLQLINQSNAIYNSDKLGVSASAICDSRSSEHSTDVMGANLNLDVSFVPMIPVTLFVPLPNMSTESTRLNSVALNKIIHKKGILTRKIVTENGATISTDNLLFDDKTGSVVLTRTTNEYNDSLYKFHYPAHWIYPGLSAAYVSSDVNFTPSLVSGNTYSVPNNIYKVLTEGDEIITGNGLRSWVMSKTTANNITLESAQLGNPLGPLTQPCTVLRPGRRNQLMLEAGTVVTHYNPIDINTNSIVFSESDASAKIINASMQEFKDTRIPYCNCDQVIIPPCRPTSPPRWK